MYSWLSENNKSLFGIPIGNNEFSKYVLQYIFRKDKRLVRLIRGKKCRTTQHFMDEIGAALQFPHCFGENWYALEDCLTTLYECRPLCEILLLIDDFSQFLIEENDEEVKAFIVTLTNVRNFWWSEINNEYDDWDNHLRTPFKCLLLQCQDECTVNWDRFECILKSLELEEKNIEQVFIPVPDENV